MHTDPLEKTGQIHANHFTKRQKLNLDKRTEPV